MADSFEFRRRQKGANLNIFVTDNDLELLLSSHAGVARGRHVESCPFPHESACDDSSVNFVFVCFCFSSNMKVAKHQFRGRGIQSSH